MAETDDGAAQKTEQPTPRRLDKAQKEGQIPQSKELYHALVLGGALLFFWWQSGAQAYTLFLSLKGWFADIGRRPVDGYALLYGASFLGKRVLGFILFFALFLVSGIALGSAVQTRFRFSTKVLKISWERVSFLKGVERLFSAKQFVEFLKSLFKMTLVLGIGCGLLWTLGERWGALCGISLKSLLHEIVDIVRRYLGLVVAAIVGLTILDYGYQWWLWFKNLLMSRQDIMDEQKETDRSPQVVARQRRTRQELSQMRAAQKTMPDATVLVMNPTHYAVALQWVPHRMMAPEVITKGSDRVALYMRDLAKEQGVPVVDNEKVARSLYSTTKVGEAISPEHYKIVSEIIHYVLTLKHSKRQEQ